MRSVTISVKGGKCNEKCTLWNMKTTDITIMVMLLYFAWVDQRSSTVLYPSHSTVFE